MLSFLRERLVQNLPAQHPPVPHGCHRVTNMHARLYSRLRPCRQPFPAPLRSELLYLGPLVLVGPQRSTMASYSCLPLKIMGKKCTWPSGLVWFSCGGGGAREEKEGRVFQSQGR